MSTFGIFGDPHGNFLPVRNAAKRGGVDHALFLGDFDLERPLEKELADLVASGCDVHFIHGNHDADQEHWHDFVFLSDMADRNISAKVVETGGLKIAGLGGVFHADVWHPLDGEGAPKFRSRLDYLAANARRTWREGLPLRHRSTIFPEDFNDLATREADILITHEAPSSHKYGFSQIDDLAEVLGAKVIIHGHTHHEYQAMLPNGIRVIGMGKAGSLLMPFEQLLQTVSGSRAA
jgi:predicted phosphodiesterase